MPYLGVQTLKDAEIKRGSGTGDGSTVAFAIGWTPPSEQSLFITINGVTQQDAAYTISASTLTFAAAPANADAIEWRGIQSSGTVITPADGTVGEAKIADDAVVLAKLGTTGTASSSTFLRGDMAWTAVSDVSGLASVQTFTSSGTWTRPSGITKVIMEVQGGGGGGSRNSSVPNRCISGAAGGYAKKFLDVSSISTSTITIGAAGTGAANSGNPGTVGGNSSWADGTNTIAGNAGVQAAVANDTQQTTVGGTATGGDLNIPGKMGGSPDGGWGNPDSMLGFGGGVGIGGYYDTGENDATGYGSGGGGSGDRRGGNGAPGIVVVWEYK
jgi:hypothetical protein